MKKILGAAIGDCIHVAGILNFLDMAKKHEFQTVFLGPSTNVNTLIIEIEKTKPQIVAIGYRLNPKSGLKILEELKEKLSRDDLKHITYIFGGTVETAEVARKTGIFEKIFDGTEPIEEISAFLEGSLDTKAESVSYPDKLVDRISFKKPYPVLRHHIGLPSIDKTVEAVKEMAESELLDVISIAPDQTAQESFFRPKKQEEKSKGAGGVPVRTEEDFLKIYEASRAGNYPLLRCYSGTLDVIEWAEMLKRTINNAWCAVPISWYSALDKRGPRSLVDSISQGQELMRWNAKQNIPVEVNESHQWSLRKAPDIIDVTMAFLGAINAKKMGVKQYVSQYMLNTPEQISPAMDLAKALAKIDLIEGLHDENFKSYREVRPGLLSFPADLDAAKGQLSISTTMGMLLKPDIVHVVSFSEAQYVTGFKEIAESCKMVNQIIEVYLRGFPDKLILDPQIKEQKEQLIKDTSLLLSAIKELGKDSDDPLTSPEVLAKAIESGLIDAPDLQGSDVAKGIIRTGMVDGACVTYDPDTCKMIPENERIKKVLDNP